MGSDETNIYQPVLRSRMGQIWLTEETRDNGRVERPDLFRQAPGD
jgi:hypothetical protein